MKRLRLFGLCVVFVPVIGATHGCGVLDPDDRFVIRVDSISAPSSVEPGQPLNITFHGTIGNNLCYRLERVERSTTSQQLSIRFHGIKRGGFRDCAQQPAVLEHEETMAPPLHDPFTITARQPSGAPLTRVVRIQ
jgi:hypothetical protein